MCYMKNCIAAIKYSIRKISRNTILFLEYAVALFSSYELSRCGILLRSIIRSVVSYQRGIKKYNHVTCAPCFTGKTLQSSIARALIDSRAYRSAYIDNANVNRNKRAVIAELTYGCICSLTPGDAATLISKPKIPRSAHVPYKSRP